MNDESPAQAARPNPPSTSASKVYKPYVSRLDRWLERLDHVNMGVRLVVLVGGIIAVVWFMIFGGGGLLLDQTITRHRLAGTWHVDGSFADWTFGRDGTWTEDAVIDTHGSYTLEDGDRILIKGMLGATMEFQYSFDDGELVLRGTNGTPFGFRLTPKD
ncbi:MAG: hypothetical protein IT449_00050 [Phycisphaerales bacterium]|nr:hypothetical protein [Phycisphaerales bacterium]